MGSLRDELLKAKLVTEKQAKKAKKEQHLERKRIGSSAVIAQEQEQRVNFQAHIEQKAEEDRIIMVQRQKEMQEKSRSARLRDIILNAQVKTGISGSYRFYFVSRDQRIPYMDISNQLAEDLQTGKAAIVETPGERRELFRIINRDGALKLKQDAPEYILFFNSK